MARDCYIFEDKIPIMAKNDFLPPSLQQFFKPFGNKFFLVLVLFFGWMIFFDKHDVLTQFRLQRSVNQLEEDKTYYSEKIQEAYQAKQDLEVNKEKYAREKYFMKKRNEDVFIIEKE